MTSDAKIGLLLGLIFIFVIAFIINGLPNLRPQSSKGDVTSMSSTHDADLGVADKAQKAQEEISWRDLIDNQAETPSSPAATTQDAQPTASNPEQTMAAGSATEGARSLLPSTDGIEKLTRGLEDIVKIVAKASEAGAAQKTTEPAPSVEVAKSQPKPESARLEQPAATQTANPAASAPAKAGKIYVVVDGDNLGTIAKKVYGVEEGNRIINNQRIFEANRNILKSPDDIHVGQELVIPSPAKPDTVLPKTLFEKVEAIGKRRVPIPESAEPARPVASKTEAPKPVAPKTEPAKPATAERWYVVQDGDNLWRIAATQLGSGIRHEEITKLNSDVLKGDIKVSPGMRLRLPSK